jgi:N-acetylgalactosamine-6-sulfatase
LFSMSDTKLQTIRSGKWKLHARMPAPGFAYLEDASKWVDPRGPDGVTLIAPFEQARPNQYPGLRTGDPPKPMMLFDLDADPGEQHDVAARNPEMVARLKAMFDAVDVQAKQPAATERHGSGGIMRLKGGELRYDRLPQPPAAARE